MHILNDSSNATLHPVMLQRPQSTCTYMLMVHLMIHLGGPLLRWRFTEEETEAQSIEATGSFRGRSLHPVLSSVPPRLLVYTLPDVSLGVLVLITRA